MSKAFTVFNGRNVKDYSMKERALGDYLVLTGRYNYSTELGGYVHEMHIESHLKTHKIHTLIIHGGNGLGAIEGYYALMEPRA